MNSGSHNSIHGEPVHAIKCNECNMTVFHKIVQLGPSNECLHILSTYLEPCAANKNADLFGAQPISWHICDVSLIIVSRVFFITLYADIDTVHCRSTSKIIMADIYLGDQFT